MLRRSAILVGLSLLALGGTAPALPGAGPQDPADQTIQLRTEAVLVNVVVLKGKDFVGGLTAKDFAVKEDGAPQTIEYFGTETSPFAAAILLDTSGSMEQKLRLARVAAARFMDRARPDDRVALFLFGSEVRKAQDFVPGGRDLTDDLWDTSARGVTKMYDCVIQAAEALGERPELRRSILLLSDGADQGSSAGYEAALRKADSAGVTIYSIDIAPLGAGPSASQSVMLARGVLQSLAEKTGGRFFSSRGGSDLTAAFETIIDELGHQYTLSYTSTNSKRDGSWRSIEVAATRPGIRVRARRGYTASSE